MSRWELEKLKLESITNMIIYFNARMKHFDQLARLLVFSKRVTSSKTKIFRFRIEGEQPHHHLLLFYRMLATKPLC